MRKISDYISNLLTNGRNRQSDRLPLKQQKVSFKPSLHTGLTFLVLILFFLSGTALTIYPNESTPAQMTTSIWDHEYRIGPDMEYPSLAEALATLPESAGNVLFRLTADLSVTEDLGLPADKGIRHLQIDCDNPDQPVLIDLSEHDLFSNGIPLTVESGISFTNGRIFGGAKVPQDASAPLHLKSTNLTINGGAEDVYGGGFSDVPGKSISIETATVTVNGTIEGSVYGGSYAANGGLSEITGSASLHLTNTGLVKEGMVGGSVAEGASSQTSDVQTSAVIEGTVKGVAGGGSIASEGGQSEITESASLQLKAGGLVKNCIAGGSVALGANSQVSDVQTSAVIEGTVEGVAVGGSIAIEGGQSEITESASLHLTNTGLVKEGIGGSVALDANSQVSDVQTSAVIEGTVEGWAYGGSNAQDGGNTQITQSSALQLKTDGLVKGNVFGGSQSSGENSQAVDVQTSAVIEGTVEGWAYGGSFAQDGGNTQITQSSALQLKADGFVKNSLFGGSYAYGENSETSDVQSSVIIEGTVEGWAHGGSFAQEGGHTQNTGSSSLNLTTTGVVKGSILGGSFASGENSQTSDVQTSAIVEGTVECSAHGGSYAIKGGHTQNTGSASLNLTTTGVVKVNIFGGSRAYGENSQTSDVQTSATIEGTVEGSAFGGSLAQAAGHSSITGSASVQLSTDGLVKGNVFGGSHASGENSQTSDVQTSAIVEGTVEGWAHGGSFAQEGGHTQNTGSSSLNLTTTGVVKGNIFGGSPAAGENSQTSDVQTSAIVEGTVEGSAHGGSYAQDGGHSQITESASLHLTTTGVVKGNIFGGSPAAGENSQTSDVQSSVIIEGTVEGWAHGGSFAQEGRHTQNTGSSSLNLTTTGVVKGSILGGSFASGENSQTSDVQTSATIEGTVEGSAYGGSLAQAAGHSSITGSASVQLSTDGLVKGNVFGGSHASGENSQTSDVQTSAIVEGTVEGSAHGGSYAIKGGHTHNTGSASLNLTTTGLVKINIYGGSPASGENSQTSDVQTSAMIEGTVEGWAYGGSYAQDGGNSQITQSSALQLKTDGLVKGNVFGGSQSSGENSQTSDVQTSAIVEGTVEGSAHGGSYAQDGGHTHNTGSASLNLTTTGVVKGNIFGGSPAAGENSQTSDVQTSAIVEGTVEGSAYGGSYAQDGGNAQITDSASVQLIANGLVKSSLFGGSRASGENSETSDVQTSAVIEGTVEGSAHGGSYAQIGGHTQNTGSASLNLTTTGVVKGNIFGGSPAAGENSQTSDVQTSAVIEGTVEGWVYGGSFAQDGGNTQITQSSALQLKADGLVKCSLFGGSWAYGENSQTSDVQTSAVIEGTVEGWAYGGSDAQEGGQTEITEGASLILKADGFVKNSVYGGSRAYGANSQAVDVQTSAVIEGTVEGWAYGGSNAQEGGNTQITDSASVQLKANGLVKSSLFGGSRASGENSETSDVQTSAVIEGTVEGWAYGGSNAQEGGQTEITEGASLHLTNTGLVKEGMVGGSVAEGASSLTSDVQTSAVIEGTVEGWAYGGSNAQEGGNTQITQSSAIQLKADGFVKSSLFGGSLASGENSQAVDVQTSAVIEGTVEGGAYAGSLAQEGGQTEITEGASLILKADGLVKSRIMGGSHASGENSQTSDVQTSAVIEGTVEGWAYGGSYAVKGGHTQNTQSSAIQLKADGFVKSSLFGGSLAYGENSQTSDVQTSAIVEGTVEGSAHGGSYAQIGGHTQNTGSASLNLTTTGVVKGNIFGGSPAAGENSQTSDVQTSAVIEGTVEGSAYGGSYAQDSGNTQITGTSSLVVKADGLVKGNIYGGSGVSDMNSNIVNAQTTAVIEGTCEGSAYGGSLAQAAGHSSITSSASVQLSTDGLVKGNVFGGSHASGANSQTSDVQTSAVIEGTVEGWAYGGSYTQDGGSTQITGSASVQLKADGLVNSSLFGGSHASGENSQTSDVQTSAIVEGTVEGSAHGGSYAEEGGHTQNTGSSSLNLTTTGVVKGNIFGGSPAAGENSQTSDVQTSAVIEGTVEGSAHGGSYAQDGGHTHNTGSASVQLKAGALVKGNLFGGSWALGENSRTSETQTSAVIEGTVGISAYGGNATAGGRQAAIQKFAKIELSKSGIIMHDLVSGSFAYGANSHAQDASTKALLAGSVSNNVYNGSCALKRGESIITGKAEMTIESSAIFTKLYAGGEAYDNGSWSSLNQSYVRLPDYFRNYQESGFSEDGGSATVDEVFIILPIL